VDMLDTVIILSTRPANAINILDMEMDSITTDVNSREALFTDSPPDKPLSDESVPLSSTFPSSPLILQLGTSQLGSQPIHSPDASSSSARTHGTDQLQRYRSSKPPCTAGATGSDGAPHRRAISATEDDNLHHESLHTDFAPAAPPRDDLPDGPEFDPQDDRHFPRRTTLDMAASNAATNPKAALNETAGLQHSSTISGALAFYARGPG
jgi:hypothetical protein